MIVLTIFKKRKKILKFSQAGVTVLQMMVKYQEMRIKVTNTQLNKLKPAAKNKIRAILQIIKETFQDEELLHELFLITRQPTKIRNASASNMPDIQ